MRKLKVLVTGVGGGGVGEQVVKALRLCGKRYWIAGTDMTEYSMGLYQVDAKFFVPPARDNSYIEVLLGACIAENIKVLVPGSEPELRAISRERQRFIDKGVFLLINTQSVIDLCMNKWDTYQLLERVGFNVPASCLFDRKDTMADAGIKLPAVVKPVLGGGGSFNCYMAQDWDELFFFARYIQSQGIIPMAQQYVGTPDEEYTVGVLTDINDGSLIGSIALRRQIMSGMSNRMRVPRRNGNDLLVISSGISQGEFGDFEDVRKECERIALALGSRGPMNLQCRKHDGKTYIFEINPRLSGTTYMRAMVGRNEPDILIRRCLLGEKVKVGDYKKGMVLRGLIERYIPCP